MRSRKNTLQKSNKSESEDDFCSNDVSDAINEAREIITTGKASEKLGGHVLEDTTTVRIEKSGSSTDPMQVVVRRSTIVTQLTDDEEDYMSSGSESDSAPRKYSGLQKSRANSAENINQLLSHSDKVETRHTTARYHKKHGKFWQKEVENEDLADFADDEANLLVNVTEKTCDDNTGALVVKKTWEAKWTVQNYDALPEWLKDNEYLRTGHRPPLPSFVECFKSILSIHTETGNIWTHLLGCIAFFALGLWFISRPNDDVKFQEKLIFSFFFLSAILCLGLSFVFHTVSCHSVSVVRIFSKLDYVGISLLIVGSFIPWIYYGFYCRTVPKIVYIAMVVILGIFAVVVSLWDKFSESNYRPVRAVVFVTMGLSGIFPASHFILTDGYNKMVDENGFYWLMAMAALYLVGAILYATRTPERFFPGKCDYWFQSHQLFHTCVVIAAFAHYYCISEMALNRLNNACPLEKDQVKLGVHDEF
uniref:Adiponectin receptor protein n=1 Tax=Rhabditophanes sp. KR3021 TaxID=114890 RepID=A0AC35U554_9BILA